MTENSLKYELMLGLNEAKKQVKAFVSQSEKDLAKLAKSAEKEVKKGARAATKTGRSGGGSKSTIDRELDKRLNDQSKRLEKIQKIYERIDDAAHDAADADKARYQSIKRIAQLMERKGEDPAQINRVTKGLVKQQKEAERTEKTKRKESDKTADNTKMNLQKIENFHKQVNAKIRAASALSADQRAELEAMLNVRIAQLKQRGLKLTKAQLQAETEAVRAEITEQTRIRKEATIKEMNDLQKKNARFGKATTAIFQGQQIVEDYQAAGFRGISNNIAFLAASLGGPAGMIALLGLAGFQITKATGAFEGLEKQLGKNKDAQKAYIEGLKARIALEDELLDRTVSTSGSDPGADLLNERIKLTRMLAAVTRKTNADIKNEDVIKFAERRLDVITAKLRGFGVKDDPSGRELKLRGLGEEYKRLEKILERAKEAREVLKEAAKQAGTDFRKQKDIVEFEERRLKALKAQQKVRDSFRDLSIEAGPSGSLELLDQAVSKVEDKFSSMQDKAVEAFDSITTQSSAAIAALEAERIAAPANERAALEERIAKAKEDQRLAVEGLTARIAEQQRLSKADLEVLNRKITAYKSIEDSAKSLESSLESQRQKSEAILKNEQERRDAIRRSAMDAKRAAGGDLLGFNLSIADKLGTESEESIRKKAEQARRAAERRKAFLDSQLASQQTFAPFQKKGLAATKKQVDIQYKAFLARVDQREKELLERQEKATKTQKSAFIEDRISQLQKEAQAARNRFETVSKGEKFNPEKAKAELETVKSISSEIQSLIRQKASEATAKQSLALMKRFEQEQMNQEKLFDLELQLSQESEAREKAKIQNINNELLNVQSVMERMSKTSLISDATMQRAQVFNQLLQNAATVLSESGGKTISVPSIPGKAVGGPVNKSSPYIVGEQGPELFVPSVSGNILTNANTTSMLRAVSGGLSSASGAGQTSNMSINTVNVQQGASGGLSGLLREMENTALFRNIRKS